MLITESRLRGVVREMLLEQSEQEKLKTAMATAKGTTAGGAATAAVFAGLSPDKRDALKKFIFDVLSQRAVVTKSRNTTDQNLFVRALLGHYAKVYLKSDGIPSGIDSAVSNLKAPSRSTPGAGGLSSRGAIGTQGQIATLNEGAGDVIFQKMGLGTSYPEAAVREAQKMLGIQQDGDFGRQTMVALATGGKIILTPTKADKLKLDRYQKFAEMIAAIAAASVLDTKDAAAQLERILDSMNVSEPQYEPPISGPSRSTATRGQLPDAPPPPMTKMTGGTSSTGTGVVPVIKRPSQPPR